MSKTNYEGIENTDLKNNGIQYFYLQRSID